jgi:hypothetical protein
VHETIVNARKKEMKGLEREGEGDVFLKYLRSRETRFASSKQRLETLPVSAPSKQTKASFNFTTARTSAAYLSD